MARCLLCREVATIGALCSSHADSLAGRDITAGQIIVRPVPQPLGWLVDQWGRTHPLGSTTIVGRLYEQCSAAVMHHSVSSRHARIDITPYHATVLDTGSLNGSYVNGSRVREGRLHAGDRLTFGDVSFYFSTRAASVAEIPRDVGGTVPTRAGSSILAVRMTSGAQVAELQERVNGGLLRTASGSLDLSRLEFALLRALIEAALGTSDRELQFVSTEGLLRALDFRTLDPSGENLRELVRRIRLKLREIGIDKLIESRRGVGYRLGWAVESLLPG